MIQTQAPYQRGELITLDSFPCGLFEGFRFQALRCDVQNIRTAIIADNLRAFIFFLFK